MKNIFEYDDYDDYDGPEDPLSSEQRHVFNYLENTYKKGGFPENIGPWQVVHEIGNETLDLFFKKYGKEYFFRLLKNGLVELRHAKKYNLSDDFEKYSQEFCNLIIKYLKRISKDTLDYDKIKKYYIEVVLKPWPNQMPELPFRGNAIPFRRGPWKEIFIEKYYLKDENSPKIEFSEEDYKKFYDYVLKLFSFYKNKLYKVMGRFRDKADTIPSQNQSPHNFVLLIYSEKLYETLKVQKEDNDFLRNVYDNLIKKYLYLYKKINKNTILNNPLEDEAELQQIFLRCQEMFKNLNSEEKKLVYQYSHINETMKKKMTTTELKKHIMLEATRLYEKHMLKELDDDYDFRRDAEYSKSKYYPNAEDEPDFEEELHIVLSNIFSPVVKKFILNKRAEHPDLDWGDFEDEDNVSSIFQDSHNRNLLHITDEEVIDIAGDIRDEISRKRFDKMFDNPLDKLKNLEENDEYDIYDDPNIDLYSDEPIQTHAQKKVADFGTLDSEWVKSLISLGGKFDENTGVSFYTRNAELSVYKINDNFIVKIEHLGWEPEMGGSQFEKKRAKNIETVIGFLKKNISDNKSTPAYDELAASAEPQKLKILGKMNLPNDNKQRFKKVNENMGEEGKYSLRLPKDKPSQSSRI